MEILIKKKNNIESLFRSSPLKEFSTHSLSISNKRISKLDSKKINHLIIRSWYTGLVFEVIEER